MSSGFQTIWREASPLERYGLLAFLGGIAIFGFAAASALAGFVPSCAFTSYTCPTPGWFDDSFYLAVALLFLGVTMVGVGSLRRNLLKR